MLKDLSDLIVTLTCSKSVTILSRSEKSKIEKGSAQFVCGGQCQVYNNLTGIIDTVTEIEKLSVKLQKNKISVKKIEVQSSADYEQKVPSGIRARDQEKKTSLEKKIENITAANAQLRLPTR